MYRRSRLAWVAVIWMATQIAGIAASPFALCRDHDHATTFATDHACCIRAGGRRACPEHGQRHAAPQPAAVPHADHGRHSGHHATAELPASDGAVRCACRVTDVALVGLTSGAGLLPPSFVLPFDPVSADVSIGNQHPFGRLALPETPPPRG